MIVDIVLGGSIFALAFWLIVRSVRMGFRGACAGCALRERCGSCGAFPEAENAGPHQGGPMGESAPR